MIYIDPTKTSLVIFDMDGTMIANMRFHKLAWQEFLKKHHISLSNEEFTDKISGKKNNEIFNILFGNTISTEEKGRYAEEKEQLYRELYSDHIVEIKGLSNFIAKLEKQGIRLAIATTAPEKNRAFGLKKIGLEDKFEIIMGDEHVSRGKPHPEIYIKTAEQMSVSPDRCIVIEDSPPGVLSGKNASMRVIAILTSHDRKDLIEADEFISDFDDIEVSVISK